VEEASRRKGGVQSEQSGAGGLQQAQSELRTQEVAMASREGSLKLCKLRSGPSIKN